MRLEWERPLRWPESAGDAAIGHLDGFIQALEKLEEQERFGNGEVVLKGRSGLRSVTPWNWPINRSGPQGAAGDRHGGTCAEAQQHTPVSAMLYTEILDEAGVPAGVFNLVQGVGPVVGAALSPC